jgi:MFS family permease
MIAWPAGSVLQPLIRIFIMQSVITMTIYSLPVIMPVAAADIGVAPESIGFYMAALYITSTVTGLFSGQLVTQFGASWLFRMMLLLSALSVAILLVSTPLALVLMAALVGIASGPMNPTGSQVLAQVTPVRQRALVFSLKQCATPAGGVLAGVLLPPLMLAFNWHWAMVSVATVAVLFAIIVRLPEAPETTSVEKQPLTDNRFSLRKTQRSMQKVWQVTELRSLTIAAVGLATAQMGLAAYLVVYLWREVGFSEAAAALVFAGLHLSGISARIGLGLIADRLTSARAILTGLCIVLAMALLLCSVFSQNWPLPLVYFVVFLAGASGNGWVGLYYAELARLTPVEQVAEITGASQFFTYIGLLTGPILFATILAVTDSFRVTLVVFAVMMVAVTFSLLGTSRSAYAAD